jgi:VWFA-related protein
MHLSRKLFASIMLLALAFSRPAAAEAPITIRLDALDASAHPQVTIIATVRDEYGVPIAGLAPANFDVSEDRTLKSRPITEVKPLVNPDAQISVVLAVDVSGSMAGAKLRDAQEAGRRLLDGLTDRDGVAFIAFADRIELEKTDPARELPFGKGRAEIYPVIGRVQAAGWTPLYDAAFKAVRWAAAQPPGNRAVLLFTDGREEKAADGSGGSRVANDDTAIREANRAGVPVFTVGLGADADEAYLKRLALETGGTYQHAANSAELAQLFRNVADLLKQQYRITYTSGLPADGALHQVLVAVTVGQHNAFTEAALGPLPLRLPLTAAPIASPTATYTPTPTRTAEPTPAPTGAPRVEPIAPPVARATLGSFGIPPTGWAGILLGLIAVVVVTVLATRKPAAKTTPYRCLQCGHALPARDAACPSCGRKGSYAG